MAASPLSVVIHGHFYQPPRDDPWLETVEAQPSAEPFHDWNERITEECYRAVLAARVPGKDGRIDDIVNTLEFISFNFGPTLLDWMEGSAPRTYRSILEADANSSMANGGHGNAIAQAYHHTILPLASRREKVSEVRWGIADFRKRFRRDPVGMWLPETAVDGVTLDVLAQEGIAFTIVAPHQVENAPPKGFPGVYRTPGGRSIALFVYNGPLSHGVAFGSLLEDAEQWARDMTGPLETGEGHEGLVSIATDGETYGHHHRFGEMALAATLGLLMEDPRVTVENFSSFLSRNPPRHEVDLVEPSSWSCSHGIDRWRSECGCIMDPSRETQQQWKASLREAVEWLASQIHQMFETEGAALLGDPWAILDEYGPWRAIDIENPRSLELLELERQALRLFTSCGWFFDDLARLEPIQVLRYAARALELTGSRQEELEEGFLERLDDAVSNETPPRTGRIIFLEEAKPAVPPYLRVAGGAALWDAVANPEGGDASGSAVEVGVPGFEVEKAGPAQFTVTHRSTRREWEVETQIRRPSLGRGVVAARIAGGNGAFTSLDMDDLPEDFRAPITSVLTLKVPEFSRQLVSAMEELEQGRRDAGRPLGDHLNRIRDLADLHILLAVPIPFDAQTIFFNTLQAAPPEAARQLAELREPLGFTPVP